MRCSDTYKRTAKTEKDQKASVNENAEQLELPHVTVRVQTGTATAKLFNNTCRGVNSAYLGLQEFCF